MAQLLCEYHCCHDFLYHMPCFVRFHVKPSFSTFGLYSCVVEPVREDDRFEGIPKRTRARIRVTELLSQSTDNFASSESHGKLWPMRLARFSYSQSGKKHSQLAYRKPRHKPATGGNTWLHPSKISTDCGSAQTWTSLNAGEFRA